MGSQELSEASAQFAVNLLQELGKSDDSSSLFFSPMSISIALAMTYAGADGKTKEEMNNVLFNGMKEDEKIHTGFKEIIDFIQTPNDGYQLNTANRLYAQEKYNILDNYLDTLKSQYSSSIESVDFSQKAEEVRQEINKWVENITKDKIKDLIASGVLTALTRLVIVNAIYFKGDWKHQFEKAATFKKDFHSSPSSKKEVDMMRQTNKNFLYTETDEVQVLGLPYKDKLAMFVFLPKVRFGLKDFLNSLTGSKILNLMKSARKTEVIVELPKFRLEKSFSLADTLKKMGMSQMFDERLADFSKMTGTKDLFVSAVIHKAFVEVNEEGSEAAAATAVAMNCMAFIPDVEPKIFHADHPFCFSIVDMKSRNFLFMGTHSETA